MTNRLLVACLLAAFTGCSDRPTPPSPPPSPWDLAEDSPEVIAARRKLEVMDHRLAEAQALKPEARLTAQAKLESVILDAAETAGSLRLANRPWYLLAQWRFNFGDLAGTEQALNRLESCAGSGLKQVGRALRVQVMLRQGRPLPAKALAEQLANEVPEFADLPAIVQLYERVGTPAPASDGLDPDGTLVAVAPGPRVLVHLARLDADSTFLASRYVAAAGKTGRVVVLVADGGPEEQRSATTSLGTLVLRAGTQERIDAWKQAYGLRGEQFVVVVGDAGRITGVQTPPEEVAAALRK